MELENLRKALNKGDIESQLLTSELFENLCVLLNDKDDKVRFFSLYFLIDRFKNFLSEADEKLTESIYNLIFDENGPVADRAVWALGITGDSGLDKLVIEYRINSFLIKSRIVMAIGRGDFGYRTKERIDILLDAIQAKDEDLRFIAMCELMTNSPISSWERNYDSIIDFEKIYTIILPIAQDFSNSNCKMHREFSERYIAWISSRKQV